MFGNRKKIELWVSCGDDYFYGFDVERKDYELAVNFYEKAAKKNDPYAMFMLGLCYELGGRDLRKDIRKAEMWYQKAAELGNDDAQKRLSTGKTYIPPPPKDENEADKDIKNHRKLEDEADGDSPNLTAREMEIFSLLRTGMAPKEIGYSLKISYPTVNFHINNLYRKLGIQSRAELFAKYGNSVNPIRFNR